MIRLLRRRARFVRLHMDGASMEGLLLGRDADHYRLANVTLLKEAAKVQLDGEQWVPVERVIFVQVLK
jgi:hypothetical protein